MKYMKLGSKPDTFYTEEATRSVLSEVPTDLIIHVNNTKYHLHKFPLLLKCGLLQQLVSDERDPLIAISFHDIPGAEQSFELCAKFCYGISISISAHNYITALLAARYLRMTESVNRGNLVNKLEDFFESSILQGWKDSIVVLQSAWRFSGWTENRIVQPCMDSLVEKILLHPSQVTWSYTYTRPGFDKKQHKSVPKDWWTEDISDLDLDLFRSIICTVRSTKSLPPPLIGEALHVYTCKHLPEPLRTNGLEHEPENAETLVKQRRILESVVSMVPPESGSVTCGFLLRLLRVANYIGIHIIVNKKYYICIIKNVIRFKTCYNKVMNTGASSSTKAELIRQSARKLHEASAKDLVIPSQADPTSYDLGVTEALLEGFLAQFKHRPSNPPDMQRMSTKMERVAVIYDAFFEIIAGNNVDLPVPKFVDLVESLPEIARKKHDGLYKAIDTYLKEHPEVSKAERKQLCRIIDCKKLSPTTRSEAVCNDRMPLRTIVQLLCLEQERTSTSNVVSRNRIAVHEEAERRSEQTTRHINQEENMENMTAMIRSSSKVEKKEKEIGDIGSKSRTK